MPNRYRGVAAGSRHGGGDPRDSQGMTAQLLARLGAHDRALMLRCAMSSAAPRTARAVWVAITSLGSTAVSVAAAGLPLLGCCEWDEVAELALPTVVISHLLVQLVKRTVGRCRPSRTCDLSVAIREPDRFSFPPATPVPASRSPCPMRSYFPSWPVR